ncbi:MAG: phosphoenolpyruvate--protein phosphotransferase [Pirellulaceae bacterium]|nr:phosphoenolpyruvate--protein phosphotransferase [Pirellulaceae bacterium]
MQILQGIAVSPGIALGQALVIEHEGLVLTRRLVEPAAVAAELARLDGAVDAVGQEIERDRQAVAAQVGDQYGAIFSAHVQMLRDPHLYQELKALIAEHRLAAELAVHQTLRRYARVFQEMPNSFLAERAHDLRDLEARLLNHLLDRGPSGAAELDAPTIVLAHDLTPSETARLDRRWVQGFVTEAGGEGGHTAILAKGLELPAVVGAGSLLADVLTGDCVIVDGDQGVVIVRPTPEYVARYERELARRRSRLAVLAALRDLPAETTDGHRLQLLANIEFPHELSACLDRRADGIGLYRTEFLYLGSDVEPTEEEHFEAYRQVVAAMGPRPVVIRTLDLGADKMGHLPRTEDEHNPFLGLRSIRLSLRNVDLFRVQLRAILRASAVGPVQILFPLISTIRELRQAKLFLHETMEDLEEAGLAFDRNLPVGMMVEVPAAVMMIDHFLPEVDFVSIGTNDLIQYTLAVDRSNKDVADLYQACDPAVLRLIQATLQAARAAEVPVSVCGQMSGIPHCVLLLLGLGLTEFSVPPAALLEVKRVCRSVSMRRCRAIADTALQMQGAQEIDAYLKEELKKVVSHESESRGS